MALLPPRRALESPSHREPIQHLRSGACMRQRSFSMLVAAAAALALAGCAQPHSADESAATEASTTSEVNVREELAKYTPVRLTADLSGLSAKERQMLPLLINAAKEMDDIFWRQACCAKDSLL